MDERTCAIPGCSNPLRARRLCSTHYNQWRAAGAHADIAEQDAPITRKYCSVEGCPDYAFARDYCFPHYRWVLKHGPVGIPLCVRATVAERAMASVNVQPDGCWLWTGHLDDEGYGRIGVGEQRLRAHRVLYEHLVGPIPAGLQLDHKCHNDDPACKGGRTCKHRRCCRPDHLIPRTPAQNTHASQNTLASINAAKKACPRCGGEYVIETTRRRGRLVRRRMCPPCRRDRRRKGAMS